MLLRWWCCSFIDFLLCSKVLLSTFSSFFFHFEILIFLLSLFPPISNVPFIHTFEVKLFRSKCDENFFFSSSFGLIFKLLFCTWNVERWMKIESLFLHISNERKTKKWKNEKKCFNYFLESSLGHIWQDTLSVGTILSEQTFELKKFNLKRK